MKNLHEVVNQIYKNMHSKTFVPPVQSLLDIDFYKFTMGQFIHRFYPDVLVTFKLTVRDKGINLWRYVDEAELREAFEYVESLAFRKTDLYFLRGMDLYDKYMFTEEYLNFLKDLRLSGFKIQIVDGVREVTFTAPWSSVTYWETIAMAIISELYYRGIMKHMSEQEVHDLYVVVNNRLQSNLLEIKAQPNIRFADFGQRRRNGFLWQKYVIGEAKRVLGESQFTGTSNTWFAFHYDLPAIGTNAHELPMVATALANTDDELKNAQYEVLKQWEQMYGQGLRIILPDTYGSRQFFEGAPKSLVNWRGQRQDSGDPIEEGEYYMNWLTKHGANPKEKVTIFSDGLNVPAMKSIANHFEGRHIQPFGWGTLFTNDVKGAVPGNADYRPIPMVIKVAEANGRPCVKLPNDIAKAVGPKDEIARYMRIFGRSGRTEREVIV